METADNNKSTSKESGTFERNLKSFAESTKWANNYLKSLPGSPVRVYQSVTIDENGSM